MTLEKRIELSSALTTVNALKDMCKERDNDIRDLKMLLARRVGENIELRDEIDRLNQELRDAVIRREDDFKVYQESQDAYIRQLKGCDICKKTDCPEKQKPIAVIAVCDELDMLGNGHE